MDLFEIAAEIILKFFIFQIIFSAHNFHQFCESSTVTMAKLRKGTISLGDRMVSQYEPALEHAYMDAWKEAVSGTASREKLAELDAAFTKGRSLMEDWRRQAKVQYVTGGGKQFAVGIVGHANMMNNFYAADKSSVDSLPSLANLIGNVYRSSEYERANSLGQEMSNWKINRHKFLVSDGKEIYEIETGRSWGPRQKGIRGKIKAWWQERKNAEEGDIKGPKIRKLKGNVHAIGYFPEKIEEYLGGKNGPFRGKKRFFGMFGRRMPVDMSVEDAHNLHNEAYAKQAKYLFSPNAVSETNRGYFLEKQSKNQLPKPQMLDHTNPEEQMRLWDAPPRSGEEIVKDLMQKRMWKEKWRKNEQLKKMSPEHYKSINEWYGKASKELRNKLLVNEGSMKRRSLRTGNQAGKQSNGRGSKNSIPGVPNRMNRKMLIRRGGG